MLARRSATTCFGSRTDFGPRWAFLVASALLLLAGAAERADALGISIVNLSSTGSSVSELAVGDILTVDLVVHNETNLDVYGIGLGAYGYDANGNREADDGLRMIGMTAAQSVFNTTVVAPGLVFGGLDNLRAPNGDEITQGGSSLHAQFIAAISATPVRGDGSLDIGIGGASIADGDVHFRILFQASSLPDPTELMLTFGTRPEPYFGDVVVGTAGTLLPFENATLRVAILADPDYVPPAGSGGGDSSGGGSTDGSGSGGSAGGATGGSTGGTGGTGETGGTGGGSTGGSNDGSTGGSTGGSGTTGSGGGAVGAVPEPGAALLFAVGLATAALVRRR